MQGLMEGEKWTIDVHTKLVIVSEETWMTETETST